MEQTDRRTHRTPARLVVADHVHSLIAGDGAPSCRFQLNRIAKRLERV